jgi:hypothetical protein
VAVAYLEVELGPVARRLAGGAGEAQAAVAAPLTIPLAVALLTAFVRLYIKEQ